MFQELTQLGKLKRELERVDAGGSKVLETVREERFRALLKHAVANSPYYQRRLSHVDLARCDITDLPVLTKTELMANFDDVVTDHRLKREEIRTWVSDPSNLGKLYLDNYIPVHSSGSSGEYAFVVYKRSELDWFYAAMMARPVFPHHPSAATRTRLLLKDIFVAPSRLATVLITGAPLPSYALTLHSPKFMRRLMKSRAFSILDPMDRIVAGLNEYKPTSMIAYPSVLGMLAREQLAGRLRIRFDEPRSTISCGGEPLTDDTKRAVKKAWGIDVQDQYAMSECFLLARACDRFERLHVMSDVCILEVVDENNRPVPDGVIGRKVLVTNLLNFTQPFIRYEVTDVTGYATEACACGSPFKTLMRVEGRTYDTFYISRPEGGYEGISPYRFGAIYQLEDVHQTQVVQTKRDEFVLKYVPAREDSSIDARVREVVERGVAAAGLGERIRLSFERVASIPRDQKSGKFKQFVSLVGAPELSPDQARQVA